MKNSALDRDVILREVTNSDLPHFFEHQKDPEANYMAAFTVKDPLDESAFMAHWDKVLTDPTIIVKTILFNSEVAGHVLSYQQSGKPEVSYWLGRNFWGQGTATRALELFLEQVKVRPLYARAAKDNKASLRVLEKCGFEVVGEDKGFSNARGQEVEEFILRLEIA
jgi:RimJ/RimL family protein N-acetyltransferase